MKIALVGWGVETKSAVNYFGIDNTFLIVSEEPRNDFPIHKNIEVRCLQTNRPFGLTSTVDNLSYLDNLDSYDCVVYTPTARKNLENVYPKNSKFWRVATSSMEIFFENLPTKNTIGITGTKGKGTTTSLIAAMLKNTGKQVHIGGNIGVPVLDILPDIKTKDWVVLELSSFQLYKLKYSPHIAVHLMMVEEHIEEWHKTMNDYVSSKRNIFKFQKKDDIAIFYSRNKFSKDNAKYSPGMRIPYCKKPGAHIIKDTIQIDGNILCKVDEVGLLGRHNLQNICAALTAVWQVDKNIEAYREVVLSFTGLEHRLQSIRDFHGVKYYDDSFGTTPDTAVVALDSFKEPKVIIVGGHDKGNDYRALAKRLVKQDVMHVIFIGTTGKKIYDMAKKYGLEDNKASIKQDGNSWNMQYIVSRAAEIAKPNSIVLLSTGSSSFGLFKDYKDRGNQFIDAVNQL